MRGAQVKLSEDVVPLGDMKINPGKVVRRVDETGRLMSPDDVMRSLRIG